MVLEFDEDFNITDVNDTFSERIAYSKNELLELNLIDILAGSRSTIFLKELKESLKHSETVKYSNTFISKNKKHQFFVKNTYFSIDFENGKTKYMAIGFSVTNETLEKKEFNKKVVEKIREANHQDLVNKKTISELNKKIEKYDKYIKTILNDTEVYKQKLIIKSRQIINFEEQLATIDKKYQHIISAKNKEIETYNRSLNSLKSENEELLSENEDLKRIIKKLQKDS